MGILKNLFILGGILSFQVAFAQGRYPPSYITQSECQENGPVKICAFNRGGSYPRLAIYYNGYLKQHGHIQAWVKLNGKSNYFKLNEYENKVTIGNPQEEYFCKYPVMGSTNTESYPPLCPDMEPQTEYGEKWYVLKPKAKDLDLLFYAQDQYGNANSWDVELAFVSNNKWDSLNGYNYKFRME